MSNAHKKALIICQECGIEFYGHISRKTCSKACIRLRNNRQVRENYARNKLRNELGTKAYVKSNLTGKTLAEINKLAREKGMSYGEYSAKYIYKSVIKKSEKENVK